MRAGGEGLALLLTWAAIAIIAVQGQPRVAQHNIGCLFSPAVCLEENEWCFDDYAFGKCLPHGVDADSLYRYSLDREELHLLQRDMEKLFSMGYRWAHLYTQCVLQLKLQAIKEEEDYDKELCAPLADQDLDSALKAFQGEEENLSPSQVAHVKYMPSSDDPQSDFADEVYSPADEIVSDSIEGFPENVIKGQGDEYRNEEPSLRKILLGRDGLEKRQQWGESQGHDVGVYPIERYLYAAPQEEPEAPHFTKTYNTPDGFRMGVEAKDLAQALASQLKTFNRAYNTPDSFRLGIETKDLNDNTDEGSDRINEQVRASPEEREFIYDAYRSDAPGYVRDAQPGVARGRARHRMEDRLTHDLEVLADDSDEEDDDARVYTEGGLVEIPDDEKTVSDELVREYGVGDGWSFKRRERLDVKKPGPHFNLNNFAFQTQTPKLSTVNAKPVTVVVENPSKIFREIQKAQDHTGHQTPMQELSKAGRIVSAHEKTPKADLLSVRKKGVGSPKGSPSLRKSAANSDDQDDVAYIKFKNGVDRWTDGVSILRFAAKHLGLDPNAFLHTRVEDNGVYFRVDRSKADISAAEMAQRIDGIKDIIKKELQVEVTATGSNEKNRGQPDAMPMTWTEQRELWLLSFLLCGVIAAAAIAGATFFFVRRHSHSKEKLSGLKQPDAEASKDYQELCRARMANKTDKPETAAMRMGSTSGEPKSPSSRSSTSSWSEEPAVSNMDISTGHMVLSYMEDHLKNKDRLEQEWVALCAYEAEPCAVTIASAEINLQKNRYPDILPYDHSRVLLNQLLNINGSDYINASTINDHDPRNAAYIATQGPLESTTADLWQMLWEQGSVVMVMLTRLSENGNALCHRYWPEEGSQIYHIYEVHLVSEHIWCDDYLVRSFYLKNLKTGETRTVTQFHFLSWPENGVPLSTKALLEFRRKVNKSYRGRSCPIVVHCSDGVGRSGTYCLIDMVLNRMAKGAKEIDIAATLEHIRDQRPFMVKTKQQFEFVLMAVAEEVHAILKAMPATHSPPPVVKDKE